LAPLFSVCGCGINIHLFIYLFIIIASFIFVEALSAISSVRGLPLNLMLALSKDKILDGGIVLRQKPFTGKIFYKKYKQRFLQ
jgi:hypothetical protein